MPAADAAAAAPASNVPRLSRWVVEHPLWSLSVYALVGVALIVFQVTRVASEIRHTTALEAATSYSAAMSAIRAYYSANVVPHAREAGVVASHDYKDRKGAIPLPATLTIELGQQVGQVSSGARFRLFSGYPFPWRSDGGPHDAFEAAALNALQGPTREPYVRVESRDGRDILRHASPVVMGPSCIECHNERLDSPKRDWKVGDVRGVQSVQIPMPGLGIVGNPQVYADFAFMIAGVLGGLLLFGFLLRRLQAMYAVERDMLAAAELRNEELAIAMADAESANLAKSQFLANMSHELRTPLNAIIGFSDLIEKQTIGPLGTLRYAEYARDINDSGQHLLEIINDVLDLAKIESGGFILNESLVDLNLVIDDTRRLLRARAESAGLTAEYRVEPDVASLQADQRALKQILLNLLSNAIKFTPKGGRIGVKAYRDAGGSAVIEVQDTGIGMDPTQIPMAMTPFTQIGGTYDRRHDGTGLGLPLTKSLIELHQGSFELISAPGEGTTAIVRFPPLRTPTAALTAA